MGEDLAVKCIFDSLKIDKPSYMDIGANHPWQINNTALFYLNGSRGINIEPNSELFKELKKDRPDDINLNVGIGDKEGLEEFYHLTSNTLSSFSKEEVDRVIEIDKRQRIEKVEKVKVVTIQNIIDKYCNGVFPDFLNIDAEGVDEIIIKSIDFGRISPKVICVETAKYSISGFLQKTTESVSFLIGNGYYVFAENAINTILVKKELWINR